MKTNLRLLSKTLAFSMFGFVLLAGCYLLQRGQSAGSLTQRTLIAAIEESGGRFNAGANRNPNRISAVYLPKEALNEIRPTMLAEFPNLRALMIIETNGDVETPLTGCMVDGAEDLSALEHAYREHRWIQE